MCHRSGEPSWTSPYWSDTDADAHNLLTLAVLGVPASFFTVDGFSDVLVLVCDASAHLNDLVKEL